MRKTLNGRTVPFPTAPDPSSTRSLPGIAPRTGRTGGSRYARRPRRHRRTPIGSAAGRRPHRRSSRHRTRRSSSRPASPPEHPPADAGSAAAPWPAAGTAPAAPALVVTVNVASFGTSSPPANRTPRRHPAPPDQAARWSAFQSPCPDAASAWDRNADTKRNLPIGRIEIADRQAAGFGRHTKAKFRQRTLVRHPHRRPLVQQPPARPAPGCGDRASSRSR